MRRAAAVLLAAALAACGIKAPPRPPLEARQAQAGAPAATQDGEKR